MLTIILHVNCGNCRHRGNSGAFTPGGAKDICGHPDACQTFYPGQDFSRKAREYYQTLNSLAGKKRQEFEGTVEDPYHWQFRLIQIEAPEPPSRCPLVNGGRY